MEQRQSGSRSAPGGRALYPTILCRFRRLSAGAAVEKNNRDQQRQPDQRHRYFVHFTLPSADALPSLRRVKCLYRHGLCLINRVRESVARIQEPAKRAPSLADFKGRGWSAGRCARQTTRIETAGSSRERASARRKMAGIISTLWQCVWSLRDPRRKGPTKSRPVPPAFTAGKELLC